MKILVIGDTHIPCVRPGYLPFCKDLKKEYRCDTVVHIGDVTDEHAVSPSHLASPDAPGAKEEFHETLDIVRQWHAAFPEVRVCIGNHDERPFRAAAIMKLIEGRLRPYNELWKTPGWTWQYEYTLDHTYFTHRTSNGGFSPAYNAMRARAMSVVLGHHHSCSGVKTLVNPERRLFGCDVGAGCDDRAIQFRYCQHAQARSVISAAVIIDGYPQVHVMPMAKGEAYHDKHYRHRD